jgi:hypothetical protein
MTQEERLLLTDLCGRCMYGVKCKVFDFAEPYTLSGVLPNNGYDELYFEQLDFKESDGYASMKFCKPYLFPLSSMTEEQEKEWRYTLSSDGNITYETVGWLNAHHFDYHGLIDKGLAIDATGLGIY